MTMTASQTTPDGRDPRFFGHPRGLATLFLTEFWERWGYYGMRSLLILFMKAPEGDGGLGFDQSKASSIYGLYTAIVYMVALPGGWIADRLLGQRRAVLYGAFIMTAGYLLLVVPGLTAFYCGLLLVIAGTGLLKPNISTIVGQLYAQGDKRRDAGFSIFYMGINMGAFFAPLACGLIARSYSWRAGMAVAGLGMLLGVGQFIYGTKLLGKSGAEPVAATAEERARMWKQLWMALGVVAFLLAGTIALNLFGGPNVTAEAVNRIAGGGLLLLTIGFFAWLFLGPKWNAEERQRLVAIAILFVAACLFWSVFEQAGSTLNVFAAEKTDNRIFGWDYPPSWLQAMNGFFIWTLAPVFALLWIKLRSREPGNAAKFSWGLLFAGLGFLVLVPPAMSLGAGVRVSPLWLTATYLLHTFGELCLSPVGLSAITKLAPERVAGLMMGLWFLSISIGNYIGGRVSGVYETLPLPNLFGVVGITAIVAAAALALLVPRVNRLGGAR
ncbi:MAG: peptide MFS transporter [Candidatus Solibacter usitatus]|nr:peptide MFS transporter [Candidatus Solibacter usitatus]